MMKAKEKVPQFRGRTGKPPEGARKVN